MNRGNVLVIGNSGVGKSTLINSVFGVEKAKTGWGSEGTTSKLEIYESESIPFRIIDSVGFEPSMIKKTKAINAVKKWSKDSAKEGNEDNQINVIWFCVEGTSSKLFPETIKSLSTATAMWETVPVIVVITKSYSVPEREWNIEMVNNAFAKQKRSKNLRKVIPVVASTYVLNDSAYAAPEGITELIGATNELMPEGIKAAETDIYKFMLNRKKGLSQSIVGVATTAGVVVGAVPIPFADAMILSPIEVAEINALAQVYGINKNEKSKQLFDSIIEVGTVSAVAKAAISGLKAIPGINLAASVINAIIAGSFVAAIGEGTIYAFEQVYMGKKTVEDIDWVKKVIESKLSKELLEKVKTVAEKISDNTDQKTIGKFIMDVFGSKK
jgi:uncharacterized protein (DUF697 family)/GTP-binding protein EngB required for normal cell division